MFVDHRGGRTRLIYQEKDVVHFRHPESVISSYGLVHEEGKPHKELKTLCLSNVMTMMDDVEIVECHLYDPRKVQELDMHKYTVKWHNKKEKKDFKFIVNEGDLWGPIK